jgi:RNA polymerase sigma-70 factor (ECF subfamily)
LSRSREDEVRRLFEVEYGRLRAWSTALAGDPSVGEDVAQEAFTRLLTRWSSVAEPRAFLYAVAANLLNDRWRQQQRKRTLLRFLAFGAAEAVPGPDGSVRDLISQLPDRQRIAVLLHYYGGLSLREVAHHMHKPEGSVRRWLVEARASLRSDLEDAR